MSSWVLIQFFSCNKPNTHSYSYCCFVKVEVFIKVQLKVGKY